jgi:arylsulfate sulfotransferase
MLNCGVRFAIAGLMVGCFIILIGCGGTTPYVITPASVLLAPGQTFQFSVLKSGKAADISQLTFLVNGVAGGSPSTGTITAGGLYTAPSTALAQPISVSVQGQPYSSAVTLFDPSKFTPGSVATTQNPLVASYSVMAPVGTSVHVEFGPDTSYGFPTSGVQAPAGGGNVTVLVAGMRASTTYHMQAVLELANGSQVLDKDQTFTTGAITAEPLPNITAQQFGVGTLSPGVELFSNFPKVSTPPYPLSAVATDLEGNVIWYYDMGPTNVAFPIKLLPNGHMMVNDYPDAGNSIGSPDPSANYEIREIDLAGKIINSIPMSSVNKSLAAIASFQLASFHHDFAFLPNGHLILLGNYTETINNVPGIPAGTGMLGDALVDWDPQQGAAVWTWSTFDHLPLTHAPFGFEDWTHGNAIIYSPDDGNLILSMRNQDWLIKINYDNGSGDGSVLWRFGPDGDFTLPDLEAPIDWNYGQHYPTIVSSNSAGVFNLMFFDNGNNRLLDSNNDACGPTGVGPCFSSVPIFQIDEFTNTANLLWEDNLSSEYSVCCGDALILPNGNTEFDIAADVTGLSHIEEVTPAQELVWKMDIEGQLAYRGFRIPSLYPGQFWPAATAPSSPKHALRKASSANRAGESLRSMPLP